MKTKPNKHAPDPVHDIAAEMCASEQYVNLTKLCALYRKKPAHFLRLKFVKKWLEAVAKHTGIPEPELIRVQHGGHESCTWAHPEIAMICGRWLSPHVIIRGHSLVIERMKADRATRPHKRN